MPRRPQSPRPEEPGPSDFHDPRLRREFERALVWLGLAGGIALVVLLAHPLLLIVGGLVFASILDGGTRLLGRVLPIGRGWRLTIVLLLALAFMSWTAWLTGSQLAGQAEAMRDIIIGQIERILGWAEVRGLATAGVSEALQTQLMNSLGQLTSALGTALGAITSLVLIVVIGLFVAIDPRLYERGVAWMLPIESRADFYRTMDRMAYTMRRLMAGRLLGMAIEGFGTWALLSLGGVPMAGLLGLLTGLLAFLPNIGAIVSGILIILVGFSAGTDTGLWAIAVYLVVQNVDGYVIVPMIAKKTVDLAPALVLSAQLLLGALLGVIGLALADPIVAMLKVLLERRAETAAGKSETARAG